MASMNRTGLCCLLALLTSFTACDAAEESPAELLQTLPDFKVEAVLQSEKGKIGSWISLAKDNKGRLLIAGQRKQPILRVTLKDGQVVEKEDLNLPLSEAMGMLYANDSLYMNASDGQKFGLFRLKDTDGQGHFATPELLREWKGGSGEHGAHGILLGPDKKLYVVCGNFVEIPQDISPNSPHRHYADDLVLPRAEDGNGFGAGKKPPGGFICRMDPDGKNAELYASGERNTYDIAFNADGDLFGFDSDMEWDWGTPWYRPIRVFHAPSGADQGFREGTAKWPPYYLDSLPAAVNVGLGSPTGVVFGTGAKFPAKYQKAFYVLDWTYGRLIAVHLKPHGASYDGTWENFVAPKSLHSDGTKSQLNLTDEVIGDDGALYFTTGGRNTQAVLYRVTYTGSESTSPAKLHESDGSELRAQRHRLESFQGREEKSAIETAWPMLGSDDRFIRYAARLAIESQPVDQWKDKALAEKRPEAALTALLALARLGGPESQPQLLESLSHFSLTSLGESQQLDKLRVLEVSISRQGKPAPELANRIIAELDQAYPASSYPLNRELCHLLLALGARDAVAKTMALLNAAPTQEEQIGYVLDLRTIRTGWTPELRRQYFAWFTKDHSKAAHPPEVLKWFEDAGRPYGDGASFNGFIARFHQDAVNTLTPEEAKALEPVIAAYVPQGRRQPTNVKVRPFVKEWTMADLEPSLDQVGHHRDFEKSKQIFESLQCLSCHRFGNEGGAIGPDLTAISSRFSRRDILGKIIEPSKTISEQYQNTIIKTGTGEVIDGRVVEETNDKLVVRPNPLSPSDLVTIEKSDVKFRGPSKVSAMPEGLINNLTKDEVYDLLAYLESGGRKEHPDFK